MASYVTSIRRSAFRGARPTVYIRLEFAMPAVQNERDIDIEDVAFDEHARTRYAMADNMVERSAAGLRVAPVVQGCRHRIVLHGEVEDDFVDGVRCHARPDDIHKEVESGGDKGACAAHAFEGIRPMESDFTVVREP